MSQRQSEFKSATKQMTYKLTHLKIPSRVKQSEGDAHLNTRWPDNKVDIHAESNPFKHFGGGLGVQTQFVL